MELTLNLAKKMIEIGKEKAIQDFGRPICIAVCDPTGALLTFDRMDGAPLRSIRISQSKAYTAARMGIPTDAFLARLRQDNLDIGYFCDPEFTALPGGNPLKDSSGKLLGCVGVSGLAASEDQAITEYIAQLVVDGGME